MESGGDAVMLRDRLARRQTAACAVVIRAATVIAGRSTKDSDDRRMPEDAGSGRLAVGLFNSCRYPRAIAENFIDRLSRLEYSAHYCERSTSAGG